MFSYLNICERAKNHVIEINLLSKENESSQQVWCSHPVLSRKKWKQLLFIFLLFDFFLIWIKIMTHETNISCFGEKLMDAFLAKIIFNIIPFCNNIITICIILSFTTQKACHRYLIFFLPWKYELRCSISNRETNFNTDKILIKAWNYAAIGPAF